MAWGGRAQAAATTRASSGVQRTSPPDKGTGEPANYGPGRRGASPPPQCTVIVACPVLPSLVARNTTLPAARGCTSARAPNPCRLMTVLSAADQDTARFDSGLPAASRRSARNATLSPTARVAVSGTSGSVASGPGVAA